MSYEELSQLQKYNLYSFYKGVCGGLSCICEVYAENEAAAKKVAAINRIKDYDFISCLTVHQAL